MPKFENRLDKINLRPSPLVLLVRDLMTKFPAASPDIIDKVVISSKCDPELAEQLLNESMTNEEAPGPKDRSQSFNEWIERYGIGSSRPGAEMKVYRLDG